MNFSGTIFIQEVDSPLIRAIRSQLEDHVGKHRFVHIMGVEGLSLALAKQWEIDADSALLAALLHDYAKTQSPDELRDALRQENLPFPPEAEDWDHPPVWHGLVAAAIARQRFGIEDDDLLEAIAFHTTGRPGMRPLGLTLYVADYLEPSRDFPDVSDRRREILAADSPKEAARMTAEQKLRFLQSTGKSIHGRTLAMVKWLREDSCE